MNFTFDELKLARERGYSDDEIWNTLASEDKEISLAKQRGYSLDEVASITSGQPIPEPERREGGGVVGGAADIGIQFMKGLGTGTRMISDVFGANNPVSKSIAGYEDYFDSLLSAESKQDSQEISRILKDAEGKGILPQIMAGLEAFTVAPAEMTATTMGIMLPNLAGGVYAKAAQLTKAGVIGLQMGIGAAQGAGSVKGQIYTAVQEELRQQGLPEDKIDDIATEAQAYNGKNLDQILIGAGLGAAASSTGAEKIMTRLITGAGKEASEDIIKSVIKGGFSEAPIEALQGGQEKIAENVALQRIGVDVPTMQGVIPAATMEATAGLLIGGGFGGVEALTSPEQKEEKKIDKQSNQVANELLAENTPATQSVVKELARRENAVANLQEAYDALEPTSQEAQKLKLELSEAQRNLSAFKEVANKVGLSETITTIEEQQAALAKTITAPAEPKPLPTDVLPTETLGATYGREEQVYDVFGDITRKPVSIPKPAELPAAPTIEEQTAEGTYGGQTGVFDVFAGARRKPVEVAPPIAEAAPVEPTTPAPVREEGVRTALEIVPQEVLEAFSENQPIMERIRKDALEKKGGSLQTYITASVRTKGVPKSQIQPITNKILKQFQESGLIADVEEAVANEVENISSIKEKKKSDEVKLQAALQRTGETYELDTAIQDYRNKQIELERAQKSMLITPALRQMERVGAKNNLEKSKQRLISIATKPAPVTEQAAPAEAPAPEVAMTMEQDVNRERKGIQDKIKTTLESNKPFVFRGDGFKMMITKSSKEGAKYQATLADEKGPYADFQFDSLDKIDEDQSEIISYIIQKDRPDIPDDAPFVEYGNRTFQYELRGRPAGPKTVPSGYLSTEKGGRYGIASFNRILTDKEIKDYELKPIGYKDEVAPTPAVSETIAEPVSVENVVGKKVTDSMGALPQKATKAREALQGYTPIFKIGDFYEFIGEEAGLSGSTVVGTGKSARSSLPYHQASKLQEIANKTGKPIAIIANTKVAEIITPAVSETITKPKLGQKGGVLIPTKEDVRYNPLGYDIADVVEDIKQGKTSTPLKAVNQVIKESTDLRKRVAAESARRQQPRKMGKAAILERIARERSAGNINENTAKALTDFINRVNEDAIWDTAISIRAKGVSNYDFADNLVTFFLNQDKGDFGASVGIHEFWHGLSRFLPDTEVEKINKDYTKELAGYLKENPWFLAFVGRYSLTPEQFEAYKKFNPKEAETKLTPVKDDQGNIVKYNIKFDKDNYRYIMLDEFIAEKMTDLVLGKQQEPNTFLGKLAKVLREFMALIKARLGIDAYEKFYQAVTSTNGKLTLQRQSGVAPAMQIYEPLEYDYSTRRMELQTKDARFAELEAKAKAGDKEAEAEAQRMVDEAAKEAGYDVKAGHATPFNFTQFDRNLISDSDPDTRIRGFFFSTKPSKSASYVSGIADRGKRGDVKIINAFLNLGKTIDRRQAEQMVRNQISKAEDRATGEMPDSATFPSGYDSVVFKQPWVLTNEKQSTFEKIGELREGNFLLKRNDEYGGVDLFRVSEEGIQESITGYENLADAYDQNSEGIYIVRDSNQIKSADPFTYDDTGNLIPLSDRFQPTSPDIRRMAVEADKEQIKGEKIGPPKKTPEGIIAKTQELLRKQFDPSKVSDKNTTEAFRALGRLMGKGGTDFAKELNDIGRVVDKSGAASEISMGAALFVNDLFEYSIRLAAEGNKKMLGIMLSNINKLPTAGIGVSDAARDLRARLEIAQRFLTMGQAEQDAYTNYVAEFIYGPNPTKEQIQSIKDAYAAVEKTPQVTEQELTDEIAAVGGRTGTDLVGKINEEFTKATEKKTQQRKTEEAELDEEYKKIQKQADAEIEKLAKIQSDTPSFDPAAARQTANDVRAIVAADLKQRPDMGRKAPWKSMLVAKLQEAGVELTAAETLADIVWRQHEINSLSRELSSINKAIEKGPISEIVKAIKDTPLEDQQKPNWRYEVMRDYLRKAGLNVAQSERIAKLMDISLQKRFTMAQEQAFTDAISKTAPWKSGDTRSRRAFQKVLQALRAGALDPARNVLSDMAALNGWTGFTPEQYKDLLKYDAILADPESGELKKAEAYKAIQDVISKAKLPIRARDVIGQYYDAQALSGIPTLTVNSFSPIAFAMRNAIVEIGSGTLKGNPKAITNAATAFVDSIKSWANTVAFSFKNNVTVYSNVDYIVNDDNLLRLYRRGVDQFKGGKTPRERADGVKNMMIGMMDYVRRILNALDYGAIASLQNQNISKYSMAVMKRQKMSTKEANDMFAVMMKAKNDFYLQQIAIGTDKNKASILADEFYISSWNDALTKAGIEKSDIKQAMDAAINDALSSVGRNRQSLDSLKDESSKLKDAGVSSMPALWLLESMANAANQTENQILKLFSRIIYGYAIVPARVIRETAWFSPYGFVRFGYDAIAKKMGKTSPYAQSLGTDVQYSQRLNEAIAGTVALIALASLRAGSTDEPEEDEFKIVFTGNGPKRSDDAQFYDSWYKAGNKPNSMIVSFGKTKFTLNMMRGFEAFTWPAMTLGALDDLEIRKKQKRDTNTASQIEDASIVAGFVFDAALRRGPYAFTTKSLFGTYGDIGVEGVAKGLTFPAKTLIPVLGTSLASNISNFINDPIDRRTLDGAVWSNIPFIGPAVAPKSLNAFGEPSLSTDFASKMFKLGVPIVYDIPADRESIMLHELVLKQGGGPSIPTRNQLAQRLDRQPTNKEYEMFVKEYGAVLTKSMKKNYEKLFAMKPEAYTKVVERIGNRARDIAENKVRVAAKKP